MAAFLFNISRCLSRWELRPDNGEREVYAKPNRSQKHNLQDGAHFDAFHLRRRGIWMEYVQEDKQEVIDLVYNINRKELQFEIFLTWYWSIATYETALSRLLSLISFEEQSVGHLHSVSSGGRVVSLVILREELYEHRRGRSLLGISIKSRLENSIQMIPLPFHYFSIWTISHRYGVRREL